jgi:hypothetical protein
MKKTMKKIAYSAASISVLGLLMGGSVLGASTTITPPPPSGMATGSFSTLLTYVVNFILSILGILGIVGIAVAGVLYITSGGDEKRTENAKKWMLYSIVGIIVAILGYVIVKTIESILVGGSGGKW